MNYVGILLKFYHHQKNIYVGSGSGAGTSYILGGGTGAQVAEAQEDTELH